MKLFSSKQNDAEVATLIGAGDRARDARDWRKAVEFYASAVDRNPKLTQIWVQLGNCRKEAGLIDQAEAAYRKSLELDSSLADTYLQLGHVLKLQARMSEARLSYERAAELDPRSEPARNEAAALANISVTVGAPLAGVQARRLVFDCSDLVQYFMDNRLPTGIQRVQIHIIKSAFANDKHKDKCFIVFYSANSKSWRKISQLDFIYLTNMAQQVDTISEGAWIAVRNNLCGSNTAAPFTFSLGDSLIGIGTSWWIEDYFLQIRNLKTNYNIVFIPFVHDCIPLIVPEYCANGLVKQFSAWISGVFELADGFLVNSRSTMADVLKIAAKTQKSRPNVYVVRLDGDMRSGQTADSKIDQETILDRVCEISKIRITHNRALRFVLCVSTLEIRKNHLLLFRVWESLIDLLGMENTPYLFCVGKKGWHFESSLSFLASRPNLKGRIKLLENINDAALATLYETCLFSVYPSHYEGWGLPVTESLCFGKVPVVSRNSSLPEAGGDFAQYFDPSSIDDAYAAIEKLLVDEGRRSAAESRIRSFFRPRGWRDIADELITHTEAIKKDADAMSPTPVLGGEPWTPEISPGTIYRMLPVDALDGASSQSAENLRIGNGWHRCEDWGAWTAALTARLRFRLPVGAPGALLFYLQLKGPAEIKINVEVESKLTVETFVVPLEPNQSRWVKFRLHADARSSNVEEIVLSNSKLIDLNSIGDGLDKRSIGCGVMSVAYCAESDMTARMNLLESIVATEGLPGTLV